MATIQNKRGTVLANVSGAALKPGEIAFYIGNDANKGLGYVGIDGQAGTAVPFRAGSAQTADTATKLATAQNISVTGNVTAPAVAFDGSGAVTLNATIPNGVITKDMLGTILQDSIDKAEDSVQTITAATGNSGITIGGTATAPTIAIKIDPAADNALKATADGLKVELEAAPEYTIVKKQTADAGDVSTYQLQKDGVDVAGSIINIPLDYLVKEATLKEVPVGGDDSGLPDGHKYIDFVVNAKAGTGTETHIYLDVADLVDVYTSGSAAGDPIVVSVSNDNKITATVTAGTITKAMLVTDVQTTLNKADTALQESDIVATGAAGTNGTITVKGNEIAVKGLGDAAYRGVDTANGVAGLDANGKLPEGLIPDISDKYIELTEKGETVATLDGDKKVPAAQLRVATTTVVGVVKASDEIAVATDGAMTVNTVDCGIL